MGIDEVGRYLSEEYSIPRGVKQGSILLYTSTVSISYGSPLLKQPHCSMLGGGGVLHVDNVRTVATSEACLQAQLTLGNDFTTSNFLQLKLDKCKIGKDQQVAVPTRG